MTNIVQLNVPSPTPPVKARHAALMSCFAGQRRIGDDVFWLKENAELLNVLECSGAEVTEDALSAYEGFYANVERRIQFFPQYYRFLLSICLDLEDLGMRGDKGEALVHWAADQGFAEAELSDLQRFEARRLMLRRGRDPLAHDAGLEARLRRFISRAATFSMPNKKAAYELTHAVFYLSEYGRHDPGLDDGAKRALEFAGLLAFLEQNGDLLSEVCVAMRHAGMTPPNVWEDWLIRHTHRFTVEAGEHLGVHDDYHEFLVCNWFAALAGQEMFAKPVTPERMCFTRPGGVAGPLRELSECMFQLDDRSGDWAAMRPVVLDHLSDDAQVILSYAERSCDRFDAFFEGFARSHPVRVAQ
ncbi:hypothetical protein SAMN04490248_106158 [Salinihabitans flavidus]|uniref:Uncharacterized protein n=1 Tax=Salinihabitans flavidus TaxID=569882 RepID=A0A1H8QH09_9RHOB|nr:hypothetical protein [Salinihabitans flavidus]SEO53318.1 hypothetical protein SAMN04490248_106158 [Salinihabitans flavidus]